MATLADEVNRRLLFSIVHAQMSNALAAHVDGVLGRTGATTQHILVVLDTVSVHVAVAQVLTAERADEVELLELGTILVYKSRPLVHLIARLLVELILEVVILLLELLR